MDVSQGVYTEMCEKATEVQALCPFEEGDFMFNKSANNGRGMVYVNYSHQPNPKSNEWKMILRKEDDLMDNNVWLPRQDQLQQLIKPKHEIYFNKNLFVLIAFAEWYYLSTADQKDKTLWNYIIEFKSNEQLWLAYYMAKVHSKYWSGNTDKVWVKLDKLVSPWRIREHIPKTS